jgi:hypothetical protein
MKTFELQISHKRYVFRGIGFSCLSRARLYRIRSRSSRTGSISKPYLSISNTIIKPAVATTMMIAIYAKPWSYEVSQTRHPKKCGSFHIDIIESIKI